MAAIVLFAAAACSSGGNEVDQAGTCVIHPGTVCRDQKLHGVSMVAADLRGADFSGADLTNADLRNTDLRGAKFVKAQLGAANFTGANLTNADLSGASLFGTNFTGAKMSGVNKTGAFSCGVTQPDGALVAGSCPAGNGSVIPTPAKPTGPPSIQYFRAIAPGPLPERRVGCRDRGGVVDRERHRARVLGRRRPHPGRCDAAHGEPAPAVRLRRQAAHRHDAGLRRGRPEHHRVVHRLAAQHRAARTTGA